MNETRNPILVGCCTWSYDDWVGPFFPEGTPREDYLRWYADRFPIVEVDSTFYKSPSAATVQSWCKKTPKDFKFALKVPQVITHTKRLIDCQKEVEDFVSSILHMEDKLMVALLQMGYFNRTAFASLDDFLPVLDDFLASWPHDRVPLAVETRNPRWVTQAFIEVLRDHGAALTLTEQKWMPKPVEIAEKFDPVTGPISYARLLGDREAIEKITTTWDRTVIDHSTDLAMTADVIRTIADRVPVVAFASNHYAGHSPATARELMKLLGLPDIIPPDRPRTTLFD